jgi:cysteine/histidine-rich domain-containing protein
MKKYSLEDSHIFLCLFLEKCQFHPGAPIFHDAYKGWSCCNKKSTDFTEFLNFKGCTKGKHSNEKPPEPEKPKEVDIEIEHQKVEEKKIVAALPRPSFDTPCRRLEPWVNSSFKQQMDEINLTKKMNKTSLDGAIAIGTSCKNGGCKCSYESPSSNDSTCIYHPGFPIFHEGLKFWTCCQRKTSDFQSFLDQAGCETGKHKWIKEGSANVVNCRWDWHQTAANVVVAVYAKNYDYQKSFVKVNPIRLVVKIIFPQESNAEFNIDLELRGLIDIERASVKMFGTKIEVSLPKMEGGHWTKLDYPRDEEKKIDEPKHEDIMNSAQHKNATNKSEEIESDDSDIDLDDLEVITTRAKVTELAATKVD